MFFLLPFIGQGTNWTFKSNSNNVADWLPDHYEETNQYQWFLKNFPFERFVVISWQGCTMDDSRLEMFAQKLVPGETIDNFGRRDKEESLQVELVGPENGMTFPVQDENPPVADESHPEYTTYFKTALTGPRLFRLLRDTYSGGGLGAIRLSDETISQKLQGILIGPDGQSTALIVTLTTEAPQGKKLADVLEAIREIGRECGVHPQIQADDRFFLATASDALIKTIGEMVYGRNPNMEGVILGGPPVDNVAITHEGEQTLTRLIGLCGFIGLALAWLCFRDFRLTMFVFWLAIISAGIALASVSFTGGTCDAILLSMPALVYVLAMSGAIHLINYYHDAVREHGLDMAPERAVRSAWYPCFFANLTTAFGLLSLCWSGLIPISKFGFYSALGIMLQLVLLFYYLPTLLHFYPSHKIAAQGTLKIEENSTMQKIWRVWGGLMIRNSILVSLICAAVMIVFGLGVLQIKTSVKMMRFFSSDSEIIHHYTWLEKHLGPLVPMEIVVKFDNEHCKIRTLERLLLIQETCDALRSELGETIGGVMSAETFMPPTPRRATLVEKSAFSAFLDRRGRSAVRDYITIEGNFSFRPGVDRQKNLEQIDISVKDADRLIGVGIDDVKKLVYVPADSELAGISLEELKAFREKAIQWERDHGTDIWRISLRVWSLKKDIDYAEFIDDVKKVVEPIITEANEGLGLEKPAIEAVYTGMVPVVYKTQHELYRGLQTSFMASFILIGIAISFVLRSPIAGFLAMIPNLFPVFLVFGFMGHYGTLVDIGTMMTASVALGIATDDTIHFLTWFRHGIDEGMNRADATRYAYSRSATAMLQTSVIAGMGLAAFALSTFTPTQMFGIMMLTILLVAMLGDLVFLAAILNTPIGRFFEPKKNKDSVA